MDEKTGIQAQIAELKMFDLAFVQGYSLSNLLQ